MGRPRGSRNRRSGKDFTGGDEEEVEVNELDLQPIEINDRDFDMHFRSFETACDKMDTAKKLYNSVCKGAKQVSDVLLMALKRGRKLKKMDREDLKRMLEVDGYVLKRTESPIQLTIHDAIFADTKKSAYEQGQANGKRGTAMENPYPEGSDLADLYADGYLKANLKLAPINHADLPPNDHNERNGVDEQQASV